MLEPLDPEKLRALVDDDINTDCFNIRAAKSLLAKGEEGDFAEGMRNLLHAFHLWTPDLYYDNKKHTRWHIKFREPPFDTLYLRPCDGTVEIFKHDRFMVALGILKHPHNWVRLLQWIWAYGDEVYIVSVRKGSMLRPLDYRKLNMLAEEDSDADCDSIRRTKTCLGKEKDLARGIVCLFEGWEVFAPRINRDKEVENNWHVIFRDSPFRSLQIRPSIDHGVVDLYAFDEYVESYHVLNNPENSDRIIWRRLLRFVWDYGRGRQEHKQRWKEMQRLSPKKYAKSQSKSKRTEKPLLHKVLHTARFKAQIGATPRAKIMTIISDKEDDVMEDVETGIHTEKPLSRQLFSNKSPLGATDPNARLGTSWKAKDTPNGQTSVKIDDVNIGGLEIMDCQS